MKLTKEHLKQLIKEQVYLIMGVTDHEENFIKNLEEAGLGEGAPPEGEFYEKQVIEEEEDENNPWAICTASVGREDKAKYERCIKSVKAQNNS